MGTYVISLGGSLIVPEEIDVEFLREFKSLILNRIKQGDKFVLIAGGGKTCRKYQDAAKGLEDLDKEDLDWLGIHSTRLNAHFIRTIFRDVANEKMISNPTEEVDFDNPVIVASGWKPGCSTDYDSVLFAKNIGAKHVLNLSNISYVYDKDPKKFEDAKPIQKITWAEYRKLIPEEWDPGLNTPFDPIASKEAEKEGMDVAIMDGKNLVNLKKYFLGEEFEGTIIKG